MMIMIMIMIITAGLVLFRFTRLLTLEDKTLDFERKITTSLYYHFVSSRHNVVCDWGATHKRWQTYEASRCMLDREALQDEQPSVFRKR